MLANPLLRMFTLGAMAENLRSQMLADANAAHGVGQSTESRFTVTSATAASNTGGTRQDPGFSSKRTTSASQSRTAS